MASSPKLDQGLDSRLEGKFKTYNKEYNSSENKKVFYMELKSWQHFARNLDLDNLSESDISEEFHQGNNKNVKLKGQSILDFQSFKACLQSLYKTAEGIAKAKGCKQPSYENIISRIIKKPVSIADFFQIQTDKMMKDSPRTKAAVSTVKAVAQAIPHSEIPWLASVFKILEVVWKHVEAYSKIGDAIRDFEKKLTFLTNTVKYINENKLYEDENTELMLKNLEVLLEATKTVFDNIECDQKSKFKGVLAKGDIKKIKEKEIELLNWIKTLVPMQCAEIQKVLKEEVKRIRNQLDEIKETLDEARGERKEIKGDLGQMMAKQDQMMDNQDQIKESVAEVKTMLRERKEGHSSVNNPDTMPPTMVYDHPPIEESYSQNQPSNSGVFDPPTSRFMDQAVKTPASVTGSGTTRPPGNTASGGRSHGVTNHTDRLINSSASAVTMSQSLTLRPTVATASGAPSLNNTTRATPIDNSTSGAGAIDEEDDMYFDDGVNNREYDFLILHEDEDEKDVDVLRKDIQRSLVGAQVAILSDFHAKGIRPGPLKEGLKRTTLVAFYISINTARKNRESSIIENLNFELVNESKKKAFIIYKSDDGGEVNKLLKNDILYLKALAKAAMPYEVTASNFMKRMKDRFRDNGKK